MGRDDRAISHNGKEARFPFLDVDLQCYLGVNVPDETSIDGNNELNTWFDLTMTRGSGDKKLLRQYAS